MRRAGLIVNPTAGMGGSVALKGTDGVYHEARRRGARPTAPARAVRTLRTLRSLAPDVLVLTCARPMGEDEVRTSGLAVEALLPVGDPTTAQDTRRAAVAMIERGVELLLFVGGDGTASDVHAAVEERLPVLGIPAGVKMHSAVFAQTPEAAGMLAARHLTARAAGLERREVMDVDEELLRTGVLAPRLLGYLEVPRDGGLLQRPKRRASNEDGERRALGRAVAAELAPGALVAVGPGTTAGAVMETFGLDHTLLGFDLVRDGTLVAADVQERDLLAHADELHVVLAPTGGQGFLLGRGNQQLSSAVLRRIAPQRILIVAALERLASLQGRPLLIDVDDPEVSGALCGMRRILTGPGRAAVYPVDAPSVASVKSGGVR
ncbi:MAG: ATP-NAD kinase family protein [Gammaproteobacteria bacterium]|nr:ATP-NAD kinase family protein [Gammaproteobacteria bacterium]